MPIRTWAFVESDAVALMPDWAIRGAETSPDAQGNAYWLWVTARRRACGTTILPNATSITFC